MIKTLIIIYLTKSIQSHRHVKTFNLPLKEFQRDNKQTLLECRATK